MRLAHSRLFKLVILTWLPLACQAATVTFFDMRPDWEGAVGGIFLEEDFDDGLVNEGGLSVSSTVGTIGLGVWMDEVSETPLQTTTWFFATPVLGFGGFFSSLPVLPPGPGVAITIDLFGGGTQLLSEEVLNTSTGEFLGFVSDEAFTAVQFTAGTQAGTGPGVYLLDDLVFSPIPEPPTVVMLGMGLVGLCLWVRTRRLTPRSTRYSASG